MLRSDRRVGVGSGMGAALILGAAVWLFVAQALPLHAPCDDAFISFRYARNLSEGAGLVYNPGEYVEGITNLLWTLLVAGGVVLGFDAVGVAQRLEVVFGVSVLLLSFAYARTLLSGRRHWLAAVAAVIVMASPSFAYWATAGLGESLYVALVTATLAAEVAGRPAAMTATALLATWLRPEGVLVAAIVFAFHLWRGRDRGWRVLGHPLAYAIGVALLTAFRLWYYGSPVPNTFYAKVGGVPLDRGVQYLLSFLREGALPLEALAISAVLTDERSWPAAVFVLAVSAYVVSVGGDVFSLGRFLLPALPALAGLAVHGVSTLYDRRRALGLLAASGLVIALELSLFATVLPSAESLWPPARLPRNALLSHLWQVNAGTIRGAMGGASHLAAITAARGSPPLVASGMIGALGYYSRVPILDIFGLVDPVIARSRRPPPPGAILLPGHQRSDPEYILARKPDYILMTKTLSAHPLPAAMDLWANPEFHRRYVWDPTVPGYRRLPDR